MNDDFINALFEMFGGSARVLYQIRKDLKPEGITQGQMEILEYIFYNGKANLSHISDCLYMSMPNASREVKKLTEKGFLTKDYDEEDKRTHKIVLSDKGQAVMKEVFEACVRRVQERYKDLEDVEETTALVQAVTKKVLF